MWVKTEKISENRNRSSQRYSEIGVGELITKIWLGYNLYIVFYMFEDNSELRAKNGEWFIVEVLK